MFQKFYQGGAEPVVPVVPVDEVPVEPEKTEETVEGQEGTQKVKQKVNQVVAENTDYTEVGESTGPNEEDNDSEEEEDTEDSEEGEDTEDSDTEVEGGTEVAKNPEEGTKEVGVVASVSEMANQAAKVFNDLLPGKKQVKVTLLLDRGGNQIVISVPKGTTVRELMDRVDFPENVLRLEKQVHDALIAKGNRNNTMNADLSVNEDDTINEDITYVVIFKLNPSQNGGTKSTNNVEVKLLLGSGEAQTVISVQTGTTVRELKEHKDFPTNVQRLEKQETDTNKKTKIVGTDLSVNEDDIINKDITYVVIFNTNETVSAGLYDLIKKAIINSELNQDEILGQLCTLMTEDNELNQIQEVIERCTSVKTPNSQIPQPPAAAVPLPVTQSEGDGGNSSTKLVTGPLTPAAEPLCKQVIDSQQSATFTLCFFFLNLLELLMYPLMQKNNSHPN